MSFAYQILLELEGNRTVVIGRRTVSGIVHLVGGPGRR